MGSGRRESRLRLRRTVVRPTTDGGRGLKPLWRAKARTDEGGRDRKSIATNVWDCSEHCVFVPNCRRNRVAQRRHKVFAVKRILYVSKFAGRHTFLNTLQYLPTFASLLKTSTHLRKRSIHEAMQLYTTISAIRPANGFHSGSYPNHPGRHH